MGDNDMQLTREDLQQIIKEELEAVLNEKCQKGYKTHDTRKTKKMFGKTYRNCVKAEEGLELAEAVPQQGVYAVSAADIKKVEDTMNLYRKHGYNKPADYIEKVLKRAKAGEISVKELHRAMNQANDLMEEGKKKAGTESSKESSLRDWFGRKGAKGKKKGWVDCNAPDGDGGYKSCGRSDGEKRSKYPSCRPTPGACKEKGKGKSWGKKAKKGKKQ